MSRLWLLSILILNFLQGQNDPHDDFHKPKGLYFGQNTPGLTADLFAPGIISTDLHDDASPIFTNDLSTVFFRIVYKINSNFYASIYQSNMKDSLWSYPKVADFSGKLFNGVIAISNDNKRLYTTLDTDPETSFNMDLIQIEKVGDKWQRITILDRLNSRYNELNMFELHNSTLYWSAEKKRNDPTPKFYFSKKENDRFKTFSRVTALPDSILISSLSPDETYLLYTKRTANNSYDLFVSFKGKHGNWKKGVNLGPTVNSPYMEKSAVPSPDGKFIFFVSNRRAANANPKRSWDSEFFRGSSKFRGADIYWVSTDIIKALKNKHQTL